MDLFLSLCLLSWFPCPLFGCLFFCGTCCHWHGLDAKTAFLYFNTLHTFFSPSFFLHRSYSFLLFWDWQEYYFSFYKKCLAGIFTLKEIIELWARSETLASDVFSFRKENSYLKIILNYVSVLIQLTFSFRIITTSVVSILSFRRT